MCVCVWICAHKCRCHSRPEEGMGVPGTGGLEVVSHSAYLTSPHTLLPVNLNFKPIVFFSLLRDCGYSSYCQTLLVLCGPSDCLITCPQQFAFWLWLIQSGNSITDFQIFNLSVFPWKSLWKPVFSPAFKSYWCCCQEECFFCEAPVSPEVSALLVPEGTVCHHTSLPIPVGFLLSLCLVLRHVWLRLEKTSTHLASFYLSSMKFLF